MKIPINPDKSILELIETCEVVSAFAERNPLARRLCAELIDLIEQAFNSGLNSTTIRPKAGPALTGQILLNSLPQRGQGILIRSSRRI